MSVPLHRNFLAVDMEKKGIMPNANGSNLWLISVAEAWEKARKNYLDILSAIALKINKSKCHPDHSGQFPRP